MKKILFGSSSFRKRSPVLDQEREKWTHEDHLVNFRITWLLAIQAVLFGGYGYILNLLATQTEAASPEALQIAKRLLELIPRFGVIFAAVSFLGIIAALIAMVLMKFQKGFFLNSAKSRKPDVHLATTIAGWSSAGLLPFVFAGAWLLTPTQISQVSAPKSAASTGIQPAIPSPPVTPALSPETSGAVIESTRR